MVCKMEQTVLENNQEVSWNAESIRLNVCKMKNVHSRILSDSEDSSNAVPAVHMHMVWTGSYVLVSYSSYHADQTVDRNCTMSTRWSRWGGER